MGGLDAMFWSWLVITFYREPRSLVFVRVGKRCGFGRSSARTKLGVENVKIGVVSSGEFVRASFREQFLSKKIDR